MQSKDLQKVNQFVEARCEHEVDRLITKRDRKIDTITTDLATRGFGWSIDPNDGRFDEPKFDYYADTLSVYLNAYFEAYEIYGLPIDDHIMSGLRNHAEMMVKTSKAILKSQAAERAERTGRNPLPIVAKAVSLGARIERFTNTLLKKLFCIVERRKLLGKDAISITSASKESDFAPAFRKKKRPPRLLKRQAVIFAALLFELKGPKYCTFVEKYGISPKSQDANGMGYVEGYKNGSLRKAIQDEKTRMKAKMKLYSDSELVEAMERHIKDKVSEVRSRIATRAPR
jgi:hypothetical protein